MGDGDLYRSVWRWHFYAGLIVLPFLLWLAITGGLYLYKPEIERLVYARWSTVAPSTEPVRIAPLIDAIERQSGAKVVQLSRPAASDASWRMTLSAPDGTRSLAFVDPYRRRLLHVTGVGGIMQTVRELHSLAITGPIGNALIEIVAGWAALLVLTGLYLWWPRRGSPVVGLRGRPAQRLFWRDFHASVGLVAGAVILFLAVTGMPWTGIVGKQLQGWVASQGLGRPKSPTVNAGHDHGAKASLPWSMQEMAMPMGHGMGDVGPDRVVAIAAARGLTAPWAMTLPAKADAPYLLSKSIVRADDARALYVEASTGRVFQDAGYAEFGAGARAIEWGIATHQGQQYGEANRLVMLGGCIAIVLLGTTGPVLWWKRRASRLSAPPRAIDRRKARGVAIGALVVGLIFPMTGASMLVILGLDRLVRRYGQAAADTGSASA